MENRNAPALARTVPSPLRITTGIGQRRDNWQGWWMSRSWPDRKRLGKKKAGSVALTAFPSSPSVGLCHREASDRVWSAPTLGAPQGAPPSSFITSSSRTKTQWSSLRSIRQGAQATPSRCVTISQSSYLLYNSNGTCETSFMPLYHLFSVFFFGSFHGEGSLNAIWTAKSTGQCLANWEHCTCARTGASHRCTTPSYYTSTSTPGW